MSFSQPDPNPPKKKYQAGWKEGVHLSLTTVVLVSPTSKEFVCSNESSQKRGLFTSGAVAHYNGVNEEQM